MKHFVAETKSSVVSKKICKQNEREREKERESERQRKILCERVKV